MLKNMAADSDEPIHRTGGSARVRQIAQAGVVQELFLSERTIENHVSKSLRKLGRASRTGIAAWATEQRIIAPEPD